MFGLALEPGVVRAFTGEEIMWVEATVAQLQRMNGDHLLQMSRARLNPLNYLLETNRDAMNRMESMVAQDAKITQQLIDSRDAMIESGSTDKYNRWMALAAALNDGQSERIFQEQANYASLAETVRVVAQDTADDLTTPSKWPSWLWLAIGTAAFIVVWPIIKPRRD